MRITPETTVSQLLAEHPEAEEVLSWYDLESTDLRPEDRLGKLCHRHKLNVEDLIEDLVSALFDDMDEDEDDDSDEDDEEDTWGVEKDGEEDGEDDED